MKKFFKILGIVFGFIIIIGIGFSIYLYFWNKDRIQTTKELSEKIENFEQGEYFNDTEIVIAMKEKEE